VPGGRVCIPRGCARSIGTSRRSRTVLGPCCGRPRGLGPRAYGQHAATKVLGCPASLSVLGGRGSASTVSRPAGWRASVPAVITVSVRASRSLSCGRVCRWPTKQLQPWPPCRGRHCPRCLRVLGSTRLESSIRYRTVQLRSRRRSVSTGSVRRFHGVYPMLTGCRRIDTWWPRGCQYATVR
jgi:hypothetical protein